MNIENILKEMEAERSEAMRISGEHGTRLIILHNDISTNPVEEMRGIMLELLRK